MNYNLNDNNELTKFFNSIFKDEKLTSIAPTIMKFFIITRNYGLINYEQNIDKLCNNYDLSTLCLETIENGFKQDNIVFDNNNLTSFLINNYHDNGFYYYSFPGIYKDNIIKNGLLSNNNRDDIKYYEIVDKYHFGDYFKNSNECFVLQKIGDPYTNELALLAPEWLDMFLKQGNRDIYDIYKRGNINELLPVIENALNYFHEGMKRNPNYDESDFIFLSSYIKSCVSKRFANDNNEVGIALISKKYTDDYFKEHIKNEDVPHFVTYIESNNMDKERIFEFIIEDLSKGKKTTNKNIPWDYIRLVSYKVNEDIKEDIKTI